MELEKELEAAHSKNSRLKAENAALEQSVKELQSRLTDKQLSQSADEARGGLYSSSPSKAAHGLQLDASTVENALKRGEREKHLELMVGFCTDIKLIVNLNLCCVSV